MCSKKHKEWLFLELEQIAIKTEMWQINYKLEEGIGLAWVAVEIDSKQKTLLLNWQINPIQLFFASAGVFA